MVRLYRDPKGETLFTHVTRDAAHTAPSAIATMDDNQVVVLQKKVKQLEAQLSNFEVRWWFACISCLPPRAWVMVITSKGYIVSPEARWFAAKP